MFPLTPRLYKKALRHGFRWMRNRRLRARWLRNYPLKPAIPPYPLRHYVNNNAVIRGKQVEVLKRATQKHPHLSNVSSRTRGDAPTNTVS